MQPPKTIPDSRARDQAIVDHVDRHGLTLPLVLDKLFFEHCQTRNAVTQVTRRLCEQERLTSYSLLGNLKYLRLGPAAVRKQSGRNMNQTKPLPPSRLSVELGSLFYCCLTEIVRKRLTPGELAKLYPHYPKALRFQHPYYIDHDGDMRRLAMIRVELSGSANRILEKHLKSLYAYRDKHAAMGSMLDRGQLMLVTISPSKEVLAELQKLLQEHPWYPPSRTFHIPDLWNFLPQGK